VLACAQLLGKHAFGAMLSTRPEYQQKTNGAPEQEKMDFHPPPQASASMP